MLLASRFGLYLHTCFSGIIPLTACRLRRTDVSCDHFYMAHQKGNLGDGTNGAHDSGYSAREEDII